MFIIKSGHTTIVLPSPDWDNSSALAATIQILRSIDGTSYVYKKDKESRRKLQWTFILARNKSIELRNFIEYYFGSVMNIVDAEDNSYTVYLINNPFEANSGARAGGFPGNETQQVTLEFEEKI